MKMLLRLIIWNIFKSIGEENALTGLTGGKNCVTKSRLTTSESRKIDVLMISGFVAYRCHGNIDFSKITIITNLVTISR